MEKPVVGAVVVLPFPHSDLTVGKRRPALVVANLSGDDLILCQITSQTRHDSYSVGLAEADFVQGTLDRPSYVRPNRLFTVDVACVLRTVGRISRGKFASVATTINQIIHADNYRP